MKILYSLIAVFCLSASIVNAHGSHSTKNTSAASKDSFTTADDQRVLKDIRDQLKGGWFSKKEDNVSVKVNNGNVILNGNVDTSEEKQKVEKDVKGIKGVKNVDNQIAVREKHTTDNTANKVNKDITKVKKEFPQDTFSTPADELLNTKIREQVSLGYFWNSYKTIKLSTNNGVITLEGNVKNPDEAQKLITEIKKVEGVKSVNSKLQFKE